MSAQVLTPPLTSFVSELFESARPRRALRGLGWGIALSAHALVFAWALGARTSAPRALAPLVVELAPAPPAPPPEVVAPPPEPPTPSHQLAAVRPAAAPPEPARAGALVTAKEDLTPTAHADEPVDFTNDPNVLGFGSGIVAVGGKAEVGRAQAQLGGTPAGQAPSGVGARPVADGLTPLSDLSQRPSLGESDPCRGYFPNAATDDVATASVMLTIGTSGTVSNVQLVSESPAGQGFGGAARSCMASKRFSPGLDRNGKAARTAMRVNIRFTR